MNSPYKLWISNKLGNDYITIANVLFDQIKDGTIDELILLEQAKYKAQPDLMETIKANLPIVALVIGGIFLAFFAYIILMQRKKQKEFRDLLEVDNLTGLMTKYKFVNELKRLLVNAKPSEYLLIALDIDNFKHFNKTYGVSKGDELLRVISDVLQENRTSFVYICRLQNDNFMVLLRNKHQNWTGVNELKDYNQDFQRNVKDNLEKKLETLGIDRQVYFSSGIYVIENPDEKIDYMIDCVLTAKNSGKRTFGNTTVLFTGEIQKKQNLQNEIVSSMENGIVTEEFFIVIQPKVELETGRITGGEVLVRWKKSDGTFVYPDEFIPLFEKNHFIINLDQYVLEKTCQFIRDSKVDMPILSVNVSLITMLQQNFIDNYISILEKYGIIPQQLELELTESSLDTNYEEILIILKELKKLGFTLAIDDFGKGASSLARIRELDIDVLKLDKEFIDENVNNKKGKAVLYNIIAMTNDLNLKSLAEGIETKEQETMLLDLGCDLGQGYYFDKPLMLSEFLDRIVKNNEKVFEKNIDTTKRVKQYMGDFEALPYGVVFIKNSPDFTVLKANRMFFDMIGYTRDSFAEIHGNKFANILLDEFFPMVQAKLAKAINLFDLELRIRTEEGHVIWLHNIAEYDNENDMFFLTLMDITDKMHFIKEHELAETYHIEKNISAYLAEHTSEYITVVEFETENVLYLNQNAMDLFGISNENEWVGKKYNELVVGSGGEIDIVDYEANAEGFTSREYYNSLYQKYIYVERKIITVSDEKMLLNIGTDVTARKKMEAEISLQTTLHWCVESLHYDTTTTTITTTTAFEQMLEYMREYYNADRAYYFEKTDENTVSNRYEVVKKNVAPQIQDLQEVPMSLAVRFWGDFKDTDEFYFNAERPDEKSFDADIVEILESGEISVLLVTPIEESNGNIVGFIGVDNPKENRENAELMKLLSRYILGFLTENKLQRLEKEYSIYNESKGKIMEYCAKELNSTYGVAVASNDAYSTIVQANQAFYKIIGYTKNSFQEKHNNRFTEILVDNLYNLVKQYLEEGQHTFSYDIRILAENGDIIWVHDAVEFDAENNLFFIRIFDITEQNKGIDKDAIYENYSLQKEIASHANNHISDYIYVTDIATDEVIYVNQNAKDLMHFKKDSDWLGKKYYTLVYGLDKPLYPEFYNNLTEDAFSVREYYNKHLQMQLQVKVKIITVNVMKVRLHIVTNMTAQRKMEDDLALQKTLLKCVEELYEQKEPENAFKDILTHIKRFYSGESTYYFEANANNKSFIEIYSVVRDGIKEQTTQLKALSKEEQALLIGIFEDEDSTYFTIEELMELNLTPAIFEIFKSNNLNGILIIQVKIQNMERTGFVVVASPNRNQFRPELIQLLSRFISIFHNNIEMQEKKLALDPLTGLYNKVSTEQKIHELLGNGYVGTMYMVDIDNFKAVNDTLGHAMGDKVIVDMARALRETFLRSDDIVGRVGGDEFMIFCPGLVSEEIVIKKAEIILDRFRRTYRDINKVVGISASVGIYLGTVTDKEFTQLYKKVDIALYEAKKRGKNQFYFSQ